MADHDPPYGLSSPKIKFAVSSRTIRKRVAETRRKSLERVHAAFRSVITLVHAHRWQPERIFMFVYTGYLDESGTHDGSPLTVMGGLLGRAEQWKRFEKQFSQLQTEYGFRVWHTKKFKRKAGDFQGWSDEKCQDLYWALQKVTGIGLTDAVATTLNNASYEADYKFGDVPKKARLDTRYGLCFRVCLVHFVQ